MISYTDGAMTSGITRHTAERIAGDGDTWVVSWLSGRRLSRNQATTAMVLAEYVANYWNGREVVGRTNTGSGCSPANGPTSFPCRSMRRSGGSVGPTWQAET